MLILTFSYFCLIVGVLGVTLWLPQMLKQRGLSTTAIGFTSAFPYLVASIGMIAWSFRIDRSRAYLGNYVIACVVAAGGFALSVSVDSLPIMIAGISLALVGMNSCRPAIFSLLAQENVSAVAVAPPVRIPVPVAKPPERPQLIYAGSGKAASMRSPWSGRWCVADWRGVRTSTRHSCSRSSVHSSPVASIPSSGKR